MSESEVAEWYNGQSILITGATGFMGKVLVEKVLRSCPALANVFILVRPKRGKNSHQRVEEYFKCAVFDNLRQQENSKEMLQKLKHVSGDVTEENCGLSEEDLSMLTDSVTTVFHMAANVRFDQELKPALRMNTGGTLNVLKLACRLKNLKIFVHVSTSYCHCDEEVLEEKLYKSPQDPRKMLDLVDWLDEPLIEVLTPSLLNGYPNTYAYTKCLTEQLVSDYSDKLPIVIARPSIVVAAYKEPMPGWVDNINGPTGILIGAGKGVIRTMHCYTDLMADVVPVDMVINSLLIIARSAGIKQQKREADVYHITANEADSISWGKALELGKKYVFDYPYSVCLWYPGGSPKSNYFAHYIAAFFFHLIPAYFIDFLLGFTSHKPFMVKTQKRIQTGLEVLQYYTTRPWKFRNDKLYEAVENLNSADKEIFYTNKYKVNHDEFMMNYILGARKYCLKEDLNTLPRARKLLKWLHLLDLMKDATLLLLLMWVSYLFIKVFM